MASHAYKHLSSCHICAKIGTTLKQKHHIQLCHETGLLEFVALDILGPLPKTTKGIQKRVMLPNRNSIQK